MNKKRLIQVIKKFKKCNILVIGDVILDQYIYGNVSRISPEAPVPILQVQTESFMPGGASNVASNISVLGGKSSLIGVVGNDTQAEQLKYELKKHNVSYDYLITDSRYNTSLKTRVIARPQHIVRIDKENEIKIKNDIQSKIIEYIKTELPYLNALIIEDYGKGLITPLLVKQILKTVQHKNIIVTVDPKEEHCPFYKKVDCITPNQKEASIISGINIVDDNSLVLAGRKILKLTDAKSVLITRGEHGMCLLRKNKIWFISTVAQEVFDVSGAGDTVIAVFTMALASGASPEEASYISNYAAGIVVGKVGVSSCNIQELQKNIMKGE